MRDSYPDRIEPETVDAPVALTMPPGLLLEPRIFHALDGLVLAEIGSVCLALWRKKSTGPRFAIQKKYLDHVVRSHPRGAAFICVVEADSEPPDEPERQASAAMIEAHGANLKCVACVIESDGFKGAITRSVLAGMALLVRTPAPIKYFESVPRAVHWLGNYVQLGSTSRFIRQIEDSRQLLNEDT